VPEIEVKFRLASPEALVAFLSARGIEFGPPVRQDDQAYAPQGWRFGDSKLGVSFLRLLRTVDGRHFFALKQPATNAQSCLESETEVADRQAMHQAILLMGFYATVRVVKARRTATLDGLSLCLDDVEGAGIFLELRMVPDEASADGVQAELAAFVADPGIDAERTDQTYDSLVRDAFGVAEREETVTVTRGNRVIAEVGPARRRTGAELRTALERIPSPDDRFADDLPGALARFLTRGTGRGPALDTRYECPDRLHLLGGLVSRIWSAGAGVRLKDAPEISPA
jgi:adenylate cyclase class 2